MADKPGNTEADWILKAMVAVAASDGALDDREIGLIQQIYQDRSGRSLTADEVKRAAEGRRARRHTRGDHRSGKSARQDHQGRDDQGCLSRAKRGEQSP